MKEEYVATFHTHFSALISAKKLSEKGVKNRMAPVPRKLSSSCGTCIMYCAEAPCIELLDCDVEGVYSVTEGGGYELVHSNP